MRQPMFSNKERNNSTLQSLSQALANRDKSVINTGSVIAPQTQQKEDDIFGGASQLLGGGSKLYKGLQGSGLFGGNSEGLSAVGNGINNYVSGTSDYGAVGNAINGTGGSAVSNAIGAEVGSGAGSGFGGGGPWGMVANAGKGLYNNISGKTPSEYSDVEQSTIYPLQGAANGFSLGGPWGALGGALYGLGYSFKDDIGLDDNNFLTQMLFPIGMGDGGGLKIGDTPILDIL